MLKTVARDRRKVSPIHKQRYVDFLNKEPPVNYDQWILFAQDKACPTDPRNYRQIYKDLDPWIRKGRVEAKDVVLLAKSLKYTKTISFVYGRFWGGFQEILKPIQQLLPWNKNFKFMINMFDEPLLLPADNDSQAKYYSPDDLFTHNSCLRNKYDTAKNETNIDPITGQAPLRQQHGFFMHPDSFVTINHQAAPVFSQSKLDCFLDVLMPLSYHIDIAKNPVIDSVPWEDKKSVVFWRGSTTGGSYRDGAPWEKYPRTRLMDWGLEYSKKHPGSTFDAGNGETPPVVNGLSVDVGFNSMQQSDTIVSNSVREKYGFKKGLSFDETKKFKYLLVLDGNTWPSRLQSYLQTNSVILYNGIFTDFFNWKLIPMVHYVPFRLDYSDLEEKLEWLMKNDDKALEISENAKKLMRQVSTLDQLQCYTGLLLLEYSNLYSN
ncbi:UNVERIFIED_CONTAM: capsule-associated protein CAP1 [Siphonaria sp. JEL0065]|nr:capsule-associated protein CAP1 [Siphonaria sp. JEL0065]